ncbi:MAG: hypothetical protein Q9227_008935 [Pyrenula ochraceoflavens]
MASIGKIATSAILLSPGVTNTLANLNFDFALLKVEEPKEYATFGTALSSRRRADAEAGASHKVARKLGGLFTGDLPEASHLLSASGHRVSESVENPRSNPKGTAADGRFAEHVDADGTTIYAATTSRENAITIHLLGCLLARMWTRHEAISLWSEVIKQRKLVLQKKSAHGGHSIKLRYSLPRLKCLGKNLRNWIVTHGMIFNITGERDIMLFPPLMFNITAKTSSTDSFPMGFLSDGDEKGGDVSNTKGISVRNQLDHTDS